ncbi:unnamed protein product [Microthlaspi erraticum]|uniref:Uncharacterized protein n=1 Tax=Microthlaspi erraticum TaxID=1685480 RepID=A0A6D2LCP1_9BRAS|nr:unnamed protein product [Microthlaspi erraticum]
MASAKVKEHRPKLEPDGVKDLELEPVEQLEREGRKLVAEDELEPELVAEEALAAPMELVTHYKVNLELKWRQPDPKPPWFLIQAQEISKWACVSFVLFFPCQVLSQWVFLTSLEVQTFVPQLKALLSVQSSEVPKVVKKEPSVRDKVEKEGWRRIKELIRGPRIEKPRLERLELRDHDLIGHELIDLFKPLCKTRGDKRKDPPAQAPSAKPSQLTMTLFPTKFENGKIEYKIRYKGRSRPFSRAKALVTSEQSRDPTKLKELLSQVLTITLDGGTSSTNA